MTRIAAAACALCALAGAPPAAAAAVIGRSVDGRPIRAVRLGDPASPRKALVVGAVHGDERGGLRVTRALRRLRVTGVDLWVVDTANPDGLAAGRRQNAHGVDLNRNFGFDWRRSLRGSRYWSGTRPFSEPESRAIRRLVSRIRPAVSIWYHQPWNAVLTPCGRAPALQRRYARRTHMRLSCRGHELRGTAVRWERHAVPGAAAFVVELHGGNVSPRTARMHARAALAAARGR